MHPAITPTTSEVLASLLIQHGSRGGGSVFAEHVDLDVLGSEYPAERPCEYGRGAWIGAELLRSYTERAGVTSVNKHALCQQYRLKEQLRRALQRIPGHLANDRETTSKLLAKDGVSQAALDAGVAAGLLETYRPARKRTDWYRIAG